MDSLHSQLNAGEDYPRKIIRRAISDARFLGFGQLLISGGIYFVSIAFSGRLDLQLITGTTLIAAGPGVLYVVEAHLLSRGEARAVNIGFFGSIIHLIALVFLIVLGCGGVLSRSSISQFVLVPVVCTAVLIPALIAFIIHTNEGRRIAPLVDEKPPAGFEAVMRVTPVDEKIVQTRTRKNR